MPSEPVILRDLRFALKSLLRSPGLTIVAIVTLGLGIGANTSMFSVLNGYVFRPPPYPASGELERIYRATPSDPDGSISPADYLDLKRDLRGYGEIAAYGPAEMNLSEPGKPAELARGMRAAPNLFSTLRSGPRIGRTFRAEETLPGNDRVLIVSHRFWQERLASDPGVLRRTVRVNGEVHQIVGVLPESFSDWRHLNATDLFKPLALDAKEMRDRGSAWIRLVGRRAPGVTPAEAAGLVAGFGRRLTAAHPVVHAGSTWRTVPLADSFLPGNGQTVITMLVALSGFVVLIACSNLANLLLARTMARARELALRSALGASRLQVLRPLFLESLLLAFLGGAFAVYVAQWAFVWLEKQSVGEGGLGFDLVFDWRVLAWAFGACLFTAVAFGVAPALFALRLDPNVALRAGARGNTGDRGHQRFRHVLIVGQFALALVLLAGAALFIRGVDELNTRGYGWSSDGLVSGSILLPASRYPGSGEIEGFQRQALERLEALPGVESASLSYTMPYFGLGELRKYVVAGRPAPQPGQEPGAVINGVSPHYFETVGTRLVSGRAFNDGDNAGSPRVFIISQGMAQGLFPGENPLGRRIARAGGERLEWGTVVGVAANVESALPEESSVSYQLYQPMAQEPRPANEIAVRTAGAAPAAVVESIRTTMMSLDPDLPVRSLRPAGTTIARANYGLGVLSRILTALGLLGLGLASLGIYGVISRAVAERTTEFGIRLALGAVANDITRMVLTSGTKLALVGSALGLLGAFGFSRLIGAAWPNMEASSPLLMAAVALLLMTVALVACYLPARHVSRISPAETLKAQ